MEHIAVSLCIYMCVLPQHNVILIELGKGETCQFFEWFFLLDANIGKKALLARNFAPVCVW